jgi:hypothetical protein
MFAMEAAQIQKHWAKHLDAPVVETNSIGMKLVLIPPGEFMMGSPKELIEEEMLKPHADAHLPGEGPQHRVRISDYGWFFRNAGLTTHRPPGDWLIFRLTGCSFSCAPKAEKCACPLSGRRGQSPVNGCSSISSEFVSARCPQVRRE